MAEPDAQRNESEGEDDTSDVEPPVRSIMERRTAGEFPEVLPSDSCCAADGATPANDILAWVRKAEHAKIQSYIDECYATYCASGVVLGGSEALNRATWVREYYFVHLEEYFRTERATHTGTHA